MLLTFAAVPAFSQTNEAAKSRGEELLVKAREAIGGDAKINAVKSLSLAGKFQLGPAINEVEFDFLFPDKYLKREKLSTPLGLATRTYGLDGETAWINVTSPNAAIQFQNVSQKDADDQKFVSRAGAARWILGLLLRTTGRSSTEISYAGEGDADGKRADLIDVKGADGFQTRLFLDKATHRLAMMSYTGKLMSSKRTNVKTDQNGNITQEESDSTGSTVAGMKTDEVRVRFSDYRAVDGIQIPHRVVFQSGAGTKEEWELTKVQINAALAPEMFKKKG